MKRERARLPSPREKPWFYIAVASSLGMFFLSVTGWSLPEKNLVIYNATTSIPSGFYIKTSKAHPERGDIVLYEPSERVRHIACERGYIDRPEMKFLKRVGGLSGDAYLIDEDGNFLINQEIIGRVEGFDRNGKILPQQPRGVEVTIREGMFLPVGDAERSFDGRYTGCEKTDSIFAVYKPLLIW